MESKQLNAVVVGGSLAGLLHGVVLKSLGHNVHILESREPSSLTAEAAGLSIGPQVQEFVEKYLPTDSPFTLSAASTQFLARNGQIVAKIPSKDPQRTTSWSILYQRLRAKFEETGEGKAKSIYETGKKVKDIQYDGNIVTVTYTDLKETSDSKLSADFVIAADGARSAVRSKLLPEVENTYAGYVAWRGAVVESEVSQPVREICEAGLVMTRAEGGYIITYLTPGSDGSLEVGKRLLEWVWYDNCPEDTPEYAQTMTDASGKKHHNTVPRGQLAPAVWNACVERAKSIFPPAFAEVISKANAPFVTAIRSFECSHASFFDGKLLLTGDAFTQFRPHMGLSCNQAALQALKLAKVLTGDMELRQWEKEVVEYSEEFAMRSKAFGVYGFTGQWPEGYVPLYKKLNLDDS